MYARISALVMLLAATMDTSAAPFAFGPYQTYAVGSRPDSVAVGDLDGDGRDDVVMTTTFYFDAQNDYKLFVFFQRDDGTLAAPVKLGYGVDATNSTSLTLADLDRNGIQDIIVGHQGGITIVKGNRARKLIAAKTDGPVAYVVGTMDVDRDGHLDVIGQSWWEGANIYYGDGSGGIRRQSHLSTPAQGYNDFKVGDLNSDGFDDLAITSGQGTSSLYIYLHDQVSGFMATPVTIQPDFGNWGIGGVAIGDFNHDGRNDVAIGKRANSPTKVAVYYQTAAGGLAPVDLPSYDLPSTMFGEDMDGDGRDDLLVSHDGWFAIGLYAQSAGLQAEMTTPTFTASNPTGMAAGDLNSDGCKDVAIANYNAGLIWLHGSGCQLRPDLGVAVGLTPTTAAIRLEHLSGTTPIEQPLVRIDLRAERSGTLQTGTLPAGCVLQAQSANARTIECFVDTLAPNTVTTLVIPISAATSSINLLTVSAQATTDTPERRTSNNRAMRTMPLAQQGMPAMGGKKPLPPW